MDEPTNHLDIDGKLELAEALNAFEGGCLLVSHDRELIERCCNRFWVVHAGRLEAWQDAADAFARLDEVAPCTNAVPAPVADPRQAAGADDLLERLCELERMLADDLARKPRHRKPANQQRWRDEIAALERRLGL
jgi:heme-transporting ATPase